MAEEGGGEKTFDPTDKRRREAAKRGDVIRSRELATAGAMTAAAAWFMLGGPWLMRSLTDVLRAGFTFQRTDLEDFSPGRLILRVVWEGLPPVLVLGAGIIAISLIAQLSFGEGRFLPGNLAPKGSRVNPMAGLKRMFGANGWIELGKGLVKVALLGAIAGNWAHGRIESFARLGRGDLFGQLSWGWNAIVTLLFWLSAGLFAIAMVDLPMQLFRRLSRLKMTLQEVRDEHKEAEGSPEKKQAIKQRQRQIARGGLVPAMKEAQFVLTNPTHFSVALAWDPDKAPAPIVLAKGRGDKALAMRDLAAEYAVPTLAYPALARSVYYTTQEHQVIREEHYVAVAAILAFVFALKRGEPRTAPSVSVPVTLRFDVNGHLDPKSVS